MGERTLPALLRFWSRFQPDAVSVADARRATTWRELDDTADRLAQAFASHGVGKGSVVGILMANCVEYVEVAMGILRAGAIAAPLNTMLTASELRATVEQAGIALLVADRKMSERAAVVQDVSPMVICEPGKPDPYATIRSGAAPRSDCDVDTADDIAFLSYTSGSDGLPKGIALSHRNIRVAALQRLAIEQLGTSSRILLPSAMAYTGGLIVSFAELTMHSGGRLLIMETFDSDESARIIEMHGITHLNIASPVLQRLVESAAVESRDLSSLQSVCIGGATVSDRTLAACLDRGIPVAPSYGQSECAGAATFLRHPDLVRKFGSCGQSLACTEIRITDGGGGLSAVGEVGEIEIRSDAVMLGYWNQPHQTAEAYVDGWLRTGDLGTQDADGFVTVTGRKKQMIISGGVNVYPAEIERVFDQLPEIGDLVVLGVPDAQWGQVPLLIVYPTQGANVDAEVVRRHSRLHLAGFKQPKYLVVRESPFPRTASGKLARAEIVGAYGSPPSGAIVLK